MNRSAIHKVALVASLLAVTGCAQLNLAGSAPVDQEQAQRELDAGIALYDKGEYVGAIRSLLTAREIWRAPVQTRVTAQKYVAFSHCLLDRREPCRQSFKDLLRLKPDFELAPAEAGHPQWGAVVARAKREATSAGALAQTGARER